MSEKKGKLLDAKSLVCAILVFILFAMLAILIVYAGKGEFNLAASTSQEKGALYRELANKLKSVGITEEAARQYENYFNAAQTDKRTRANIAYTLGKLYMEEENYEKALSWFYRVDIIDPGTPLKSEVGSKIVHCLETLERFHAAEYALEARSSLQENQGEETKGNKIVAEIGNNKITLRDVDEAIDELPPWMKEQFKGKEKKVEFMKKYVADELFYRKAKKLEYDKDGELRKKSAQFTKQLMINKILEEEIKDKIAIEESDLKNYFKGKPGSIQRKSTGTNILNQGRHGRNSQKHCKGIESRKGLFRISERDISRRGQCREGWKMGRLDH